MAGELCRDLEGSRSVALTLMQHGADAVFWAQRDGREQFDRVIGHKREAEALRDSCEQQSGLHHRESCADANARATAKGEIGKAWTLLVLRRMR